MKKIAILGATGHIAKNAIAYLYPEGYRLHLFGRSSARIVRFLEEHDFENHVAVKKYDEFSHGQYDVLINCVGIGDPGKILASSENIFTLTEKFDSLCLAYLERSPDTLYINLSSGAAYCNAFEDPAVFESECAIRINGLKLSEYYGIAKLNSEAKHRSLNQYRIIDLRVFGFFSKYINLDSKFLLSDMIKCTIDNVPFTTNTANINRDYVHPKEFVGLLKTFIHYNAHINQAFDVYSASPASKMDIMQLFSEEFGLKINMVEAHSRDSVTGVKRNYFSLNRIPDRYDFKPKLTSLATIHSESVELITRFQRGFPR